MIKISHRGNIDGRNPDKENTPDYLFSAIEKGFNVEIDIWFNDNSFFLGHDTPKIKINESLITEIGNLGWFHCKNLDAIYNIMKFENSINYFYHESDSYTLTNKNYIWTYPNNLVTDRSILVCLDKPNITKLNNIPAGICSDYMYW